ncbi:ROK family protein [Paenibacillus sp. CN-4]|uniref:ROK family protein n=1 Tax=Paenibacillus nanchangensis TaxID=3348343 RepID=UPI00397D06F1
MQQAETYVVGLDLGGTKIAAGLFDARGVLIGREQLETGKGGTARELVTRMNGMIRSVAGGKPLAGVGLASPGAVDSRKGIALNGTNLPEWNGVPLKEWMEAELRTEVQVVNDANAAAWGEFVRGAGRGSTNMVYITFSTGIGAGLVLDGRLFLGSHSFAGELGHTVVDPAGPVCSCGRRGCWETFASGTAIRNEALRRLAQQTSLIAEIADEQGESLSAKHVFEAVRRGDRVAGEVFERTVHYMALGLSNIVHAYNPDVLVIGGGVSRAGELLLSAVRTRTEQYVMAPYRGTYRITGAELGDDAGLIGAAALFQDAGSGAIEAQPAVEAGGTA